MSHHIYHTRGLILGSIPIGESNRFYKIFTEEMGLVWASAQAVRMEKSKLRYSLQHFSWVTIDLVKGREVWRIISAREEIPYSLLKADSEHFKIFARLCSLISRMVHGERQEKDIFDDLYHLIIFLESTSLSERLYRCIETLAVARILLKLGYLEHTLSDDITKAKGWSVEILEKFEKDNEIVISKINEALDTSHL